MELWQVLLPQGSWHSNLKRHKYLLIDFAVKAAVTFIMADSDWDSIAEKKNKENGIDRGKLYSMYKLQTIR